jgi:hypothetical protein
MARCCPRAPVPIYLSLQEEASGGDLVGELGLDGS